MALCRNCGAPLAEGDTFCGNCGTPVETAAEAKREELAVKRNELERASDETAEAAPDDVRNNRAFAILAYLGPLVLIPIFAAKNSKFARFHANQGLVLLICEAIVSSAQSVVKSIFNHIHLGIPGKILSGTLQASLIAAGVLLVILMVRGIVDAARGKARRLPFIGSFTILR